MKDAIMVRGQLFVVFAIMAIVSVFSPRRGLLMMSDVAEGAKVRLKRRKEL